MLLTNLRDKRIILASKSPRRQQLLSGLELDFEVRTKDVNEDFPAHLTEQAIPMYLAQVKADAFLPELKADELLITADTIVWINGHVLNKPDDDQSAIDMITELSGRTHTVYTGVCISDHHRQVCFYDATRVTFTHLGQDEIEYYVKHYRPFDKAGAYGVQELIGYIGIERLEGSYFNVMGLPVHALYAELRKW
jgi:septum formation protein